MILQVARLLSEVDTRSEINSEGVTEGTTSGESRRTAGGLSACIEVSLLKASDVTLENGNIFS